MAAGEIGYMLPGVQFLGQRYEGLGKLEQAWQTDLLERPQETLEVKDNRVEVLVRGGVSLRLNWRWKVDNEK